MKDADRTFVVDTTIVSVKISDMNMLKSYTVIRVNKLGYADLSVPQGVPYISFINQLKQDNNISNIDIATIGIYSSITPNDTNIGQQWYLSAINAFSAWDITMGSSNVIVAIIDSGTDWDHDDIGYGYDSYQTIYFNPGEDLWSNINNPSTGNGIDDDNNGLVDDLKGWNYENNSNDCRTTYYHGTFVSGIVGAKTNNNRGIAGIAGGYGNSGVRLLPYCVGVNAPITSVIDDAILDAVDKGAKVIQLSFTVPRTPAITSAVDDAVSHGVIVICASGNTSSQQVSYPSSLPNVVAVGAIDQSYARADFSNFGDTLEVVAPGVGIYSTTLNNLYNTKDGTSFAAPQVSGIAALILSVNPNLTGQQVRNIIDSTAQRIRTDLYTYTDNPSIHPNGSWNNQMGYGLVDAHAAVMEAYFYGREILGNDIINPCNTTYPCNGIITYNLNSSSMPSNTTLQWSVSGNLALVSSNNQSISVLPTGIGTGTITISYTHEGYTVTKQKEITIESLPPSSNYYCNYSTTGNMTFNNELYINGTFTINSGHVVTISCIGHCLPDAKIVIQPGGKLIVNDGKLTSYCSDKMWDGIYVVGNKNQRQLAQYQGTLEVKNSSLIENAKCAIHNWNGSNYNTSGGIITVSGNSSYTTMDVLLSSWNT